MKSISSKIFILIVTCVLIFSLVGCTQKTPVSGSEDKDRVIKLGTMSTIEPFITALKDALVEKGYEAEVVLFDANNMGAIATKDGDLDGYIHNHLPWIEIFNSENNSNVTVIEPYLFYYRTAMYSSKHNSIDEFPNDAQIAIPNDPVNVEKSLEMLQDLGLLTLGEKTDNFYTILDIKDNPKSIKIIETEISTTARSIDDADAVISPATRIKAAGIDPNSFLAEDLSTVNFPVGLTVNEDSLDEQWVKDAMEILMSDEMRTQFDEIFGGTLVLYDK